jgi:hypothetical protein
MYESIGVRPVINRRGTLTIIGGAQTLPEVKKRWMKPVRTLFTWMS